MEPVGGHPIQKAYNYDFDDYFYFVNKFIVS